MAEEIKIVIGADSSDLSAQLAKAEKDLKKFQDTLKKSSDTKEIEALNKKIEETNAIINQLKSAIGKVTITADTTDLDNKVNNSKDKLEQIQSPAPAQITADTTNIDAAVNKTDAELSQIQSPAPAQITADTTNIDAAVVKTDAELSQIETPPPVNITADTTNLDNAVIRSDAELQTIETPPPAIITADVNDLLTETEKAKTETESLQSPPPVEITADASPFNAELQKAENELRKFQSELKRTTDVNELASLNQKIVETKKKIEELNKSFQSIKPSTNAASGAVLNLSRIVQDSAFGFIGIANNIQPFIDSLGYARKEAQATGTSLGKNLLSVLTGAGGLSLGFAAVTTAITFAQIGFSAWTRSSKAAKDSSQDFANSLKDAEKGAISQGLRLEGLVKIITDSTKSERERNLALKEANDALKPYGEKIDSINVSVKEAERLTNKYTEALINQAVGAKLADKIAELRLQRIDIENKKLIQQSKINGLNAQKSAQAAKLTQRQYGTSDAAAIKFESTVQDVSSAESELNDINQELIDNQKEINRLTAQYNPTVLKSLKVDDKSKKDVETVDKLLKKLTEDLRDQRALSITFNVPTIQKQFELVNQAITDLVTKFNLKPNDERILKLQLQAVDLKAELAALNMQAKRDNVKLLVPLKLDYKKELQYIPDIAKKIKPINIPVNIQSDIGALAGKVIDPKILERFRTSSKETFADLVDDFKKFSQDLDNAATTFLSDAATNIATKFGEALGAALTGGDFGEVFKGVFELIASGIESLGKQLIQIGFLAIIAQQALSQLLANPYASIAVGIALVALGAAVKNLTNGNAFATGTNYAPGGMALVGERGPELVNLPRGSQVIPAGRTAQMMGGMGQQVEVFGMLRGQDIYFSNKKYGQTYGRTT